MSVLLFRNNASDNQVATSPPGVSEAAELWKGLAVLPSPSDQLRLLARAHALLITRTAEGEEGEAAGEAAEGGGGGEVERACAVALARAAAAGSTLLPQLALLWEFGSAALLGEVRESASSPRCRPSSTGV